jgi:hypothetical protein
MMGMRRFWRVTLSHSPIIPFFGHPQMSTVRAGGKANLGEPIGCSLTKSPRVRRPQPIQYSAVRIKKKNVHDVVGEVRKKRRKKTVKIYGQGQRSQENMFPWL